jgi:6-phosphogluconolactonase
MNSVITNNHLELQEVFWSNFLLALDHGKRQSEIFIGLAWGSSLDIFYAAILERFSLVSEDIRQKVWFCMLDERIVPIDHADRNERQLREKFLDALVKEGSIREGQIISMCPSFWETKNLDPWSTGSFLSSGWQIQDASSLATSYSLLVPRIDIALVWVGPDGHIASLFPGHTLLDSQERWYLEITDSPKPPSHRITVSPVMIRDTGYIFIAIMKGKEIILERFNNDNTPLSECPAKMVKDVENLILMSDIVVDE